MAVSFAVMNFLFIAAMTQTTAAAAIFLQYTGTGWAFLFGALFLGERILRSNLVALVFGTGGNRLHRRRAVARRAVCRNSPRARQRSGVRSRDRVAARAAP